MPSERTEITEIVAGLATLGYPEVAVAVRARPGEVTNVRPDQWERLERLLAVPTHQETIASAWANGKAFAQARDGLRGRRPVVVEWKGPHGSVGDQVAPVDLRIDHVYLVSCKYLSKILLNVAPANLFDGVLLGPSSRTRVDWYQAVAPETYQALYETVRDALTSRSSPLPTTADQLTPAHRRILKAELREGWPSASVGLYSDLAFQVSAASASRWRSSLKTDRQRAAMLWRLLRIGSAPYFVLGTSPSASLRLRIATPWDWHQQFELRVLDVWADPAGQPLVRWRAGVLARITGEEHDVGGHVEIRWSHGRFAQPPEAKVYLDTPHNAVPGYLPLV